MPKLRVTWHGGPSFSLDLAGLEVLIDPSFARPGDYPPWFDARSANPHAPSTADYLAAGHTPAYLFITHGHFDHFDLKTVERLAAALPGLKIAGSEAVLRTCRHVLGLDPARLLSCPLAGEGWLDLSGSPSRPPASARVTALAGPHWFTGAEGDTVAAKFAGRPERYGAMPCGGPMLGFIFEVRPAAGPDEAGPGALRIYASGDTEPQGLPDGRVYGPFDLAVIACGGRLVHPGTKELVGPYLDEPTLARAAAEVVRPRVLLPVHYDHPVFQTPFDLGLLAEELRRYPASPRLLAPAYNTWTDVRP